MDDVLESILVERYSNYRCLNTVLCVFAFSVFCPVDLLVSLCLIFTTEAESKGNFKTHSASSRSSCAAPKGRSTCPGSGKAEQTQLLLYIFICVHACMHVFTRSPCRAFVWVGLLLLFKPWRRMEDKCGCLCATIWTAE